MKPIDDIIVVGTDTGVGKSVVSLLLMQLLFARGYSPFYLKPFQTGCRSPMDTNSDALFVYSHTKALKEKDPGQSVLYCHPNPKAPYFAARDAGQSIDVAYVRQIIEQKRRRFSPLVVEAAGGLLVPVSEDLLLIDVIKQIRCRPLLVARAGLGTINHTLLSIEALHSRGQSLMGIVFVDQSESLSDPDLIYENMAAVASFSGYHVQGVITGQTDFSRPSEKTYRPLKKLLFEPGV
jgi:dethiobiotin synthetase